MKKYLFTFFSVLLASSEVWGQSIWTTVKDESQIVDGAVYMLTGTNSKKKKPATIPHLFEAKGCSENVYFYTPKSEDLNSAYNYSSITKDIKKVLKESHLFKIIKRDNSWYIKDINEDMYIGEILPDDYKHQAIGAIKLRKEPDNYCKVEFDFTKDKPAIRISDCYLLYRTDAGLRLLDTPRKDDSYVDIYRLNYTILDANDDLKETSYNAETVMYRNFEENLYNTLILPCDVSDYQAAFGSGVKAYELTKIDDMNLTIVEKQDLHLTSHTPYLLKGTFGKGPYLLGRQEVSYDGSDPVATVEGGTAHGVFANRTVPEEAYFIYENKFYTYDTVYFNKGMMIAPYKWYIPTAPATAHAKGMKSLGIRESKNDVSTDIDNTTQMPEWKGEVYSLSGQRMNTNAPLPRGIYIRKGKKVVVQR